jgi:two-component system cell cycle response regulator
MKILIADDDLSFRLWLERTLARWGYDAVPVADGREAWQRLQEEDGPRLALLDWMMPGLEGLQICREVRKRGSTPYVYLILVTARANQQDLVGGLEAGADDYLIKPVDVHELQARLHTARRILDLQEQLLAAHEVLRHQATHDPLTGLWNRTVILDRLDRELARSRREGKAVGVLMVDVDHFKVVNDTHGHPAGDAALREIGRRLVAGIRPYDTVGRYGGEEFLLVMPECDATVLAQLAERLRLAIAVTPLNLVEGLIGITISVGGAASGLADGTDVASLVRAADAALYRAKRAGRNRVELASSVAGAAPVPAPGNASRP